MTAPLSVKWADAWIWVGVCCSWWFQMLDWLMYVIGYMLLRYSRLPASTSTMLWLAVGVVYLIYYPWHSLELHHAAYLLWLPGLWLDQPRSPPSPPESQLNHPLDGTCLGEDQLGEPVILTDAAANMHTLMVGTTGTGKTTAIANIIESAILRDQALIYVDGKGDLDLARRVEQFARDHHKPCYVFSMVGPSVHYNPIASGGYTSKKDRIVALRHWSEDHYRKIAEGYLQTVLRLLDRCDIAVDLATLAHYLDPDTLYHLARRHRSETMACQVDRLVKQRPHIESLIAEINNIVDSEIGHLFQTELDQTLVLQQAFAERALVYFCLQPLTFPSYADTLGKLIINDLKQLAAQQLTHAEPAPWYTIFDEFSVFAGDQVVNLINQGRSAGVCAVLATQSLSDITRAGGNALLGQVVNNCNQYLIQRQNHPTDAQLLSDLIGQTKHWPSSTHVRLDTGEQSVTVRSDEQAWIAPDVIKQLRRGEGIFIHKQAMQVQMFQVRQGAI